MVVQLLKCFVSNVKFIVIFIYPWNPFIDTYYVWFAGSIQILWRQVFIRRNFCSKRKGYEQKKNTCITKINPMCYFEDFCHVFMIASTLLLISEFSIHLAGTFLCKEKIVPIFILIGNYFITERVADVTMLQWF